MVGYNQVPVLFFQGVDNKGVTCLLCSMHLLCSLNDSDALYLGAIYKE